MGNVHQDAEASPPCWRGAFKRAAGSAISNERILEAIVKAILAASLTASLITSAVALAELQIVYYEAKVNSFGCSSVEAVSQLKKVRSDDAAFEAALTDKQSNGDCVVILKGTQVQGSPEAADSSILRVNAQIEPPGYEAPAEDFEAK